MSKDIERHEGDNLGGVNAFNFCFSNDVLSIVEPINGTIHHAVKLKPYKQWYKGYCTEFTMQFKDTQLPNEQGSYHEKEFSGNVPKDRPELVQLFNDIMDRKFILEIIYNNGCKKLVGTIDEPLMLITDFDSKSDLSARNEFKILFKGSAILRSPFYNV